MTRFASALLALALVAGFGPGATAPAAPLASVMAADPAPSAPSAAAEVPAVLGASVLPPESSVVAPLAASTPVMDSLHRLGTLRISRIGLYARVYDWGCGNAIVPNLVLRWACRRNNNQFLVGHAYGVFHAYYLAYARHLLRPGLIATFTNASGHTTRYRLAWVRRVTATYIYRGLTGDQWAWSNTPTPSLTLQTCWGATNKYRIITRFVRY
ncbi:MAG: sortase family protein [Candidatus Limnocylindrales bacterium]